MGDLGDEREPYEKSLTSCQIMDYISIYDFIPVRTFFILSYNPHVPFSKHNLFLQPLTTDFQWQLVSFMFLQCLQHIYNDIHTQNKYKIIKITLKPSSMQFDFNEIWEIILEMRFLFIFLSIYFFFVIIYVLYLFCCFCFYFILFFLCCITAA